MESVNKALVLSTSVTRETMLLEVPSPGQNPLIGLKRKVIQNCLDSQSGYRYRDRKDTSVPAKLAHLEAEIEYGNLYLWKCMKR